MTARTSAGTVPIKASRAAACVGFRPCVCGLIVDPDPQIDSGVHLGARHVSDQNRAAGNPKGGMVKRKTACRA